MHHARLLADMPEEVSRGSHVIVRRTEPGDYEALQRIFCGARAVAGTMQMPLPSVEMWRRRLAEPPEGLFSLVACVDGEVVGSLSLEASIRWRKRHGATLGMVVRDDWQGKGVGTAHMDAALDLADNWLNLTRVELRVYVDNAPAIALYKKFGFEIEGTHRRMAFRNGEYVDGYSMARVVNRVSGSQHAPAFGFRFQHVPALRPTLSARFALRA
jgi:putative acetyltransferase